MVESLSRVNLPLQNMHCGPNSDGRNLTQWLYLCVLRKYILLLLLLLLLFIVYYCYYYCYYKYVTSRLEIQGSRVQTRLRSIDFSRRKNPEHKSSGRDFKLRGSRFWDFRLVKEPQAWKNRPLNKIQSAYSRPSI